jgi:glycosyltransferase involved in cell wall biosynthesis
VRILQVIESFGAGSMHVVLTISDRLALEGHHLAIAHGQVAESPERARSMIRPEVELFALPWPRTVAGQLLGARQLRRIARRWQPDVVHLHSSFAGAVGAATLRGLAPLIYTPHAYSFTRYGPSGAMQAAFRTVERLITARVDLIGAVSESEASLARTRLGARRVDVVPNGIQELDEPSEPPAKLSDPPIVLAIGRIAPQRRPEGAARILGGVADLASVVWVGDGGEANGSLSVLREAGVTVTGWLDRSEVLERLSRATACLHWSGWDAQPLSVLEAMARDVVVVASDISANRELLGLRQVCATEEAATALLREVLTDPGLRSELLADQRVRRNRHSAARMVRGWLDVYERLAAAETAKT